MTSKINTVLLCVVIALQAYSLHRQTYQVGRFQWLTTPGWQLGFDTATGKRCWVWADEKVDPKSDMQLCSQLAGR
jgi:hypothetical protein